MPVGHLVWGGGGLVHHVLCVVLRRRAISRVHDFHSLLAQQTLHRYGVPTRAELSTWPLIRPIARRNPGLL